MEKYKRFFRVVLLAVFMGLALVGVTLTGAAPVRPQNKNLYETEQTEKKEEEDENEQKDKE